MMSSPENRYLKLRLAEVWTNFCQEFEIMEFSKLSRSRNGFVVVWGILREQSKSSKMSKTSNLGL